MNIHGRKHADLHANILPDRQVSVLPALTGYASPHKALGAVTKLYNEVPKDSTLIGWVGPFTASACQSTQDLIHGLRQPQISYGCSQSALSNKKRFPVRQLAFDDLSSMCAACPVSCCCVQCANSRRFVLVCAVFRSNGASY